MKNRLLLATLAGLAWAAPAQAQNMWWVEGDRFCDTFRNQYSNNAMCGNARRGETRPSSTFRLEFYSPLGQDFTTVTPPPPPIVPLAPPARPANRP